MPSTSFLKSKSHFRKPVITQELYTYFHPLPELALATFPLPSPWELALLGGECPTAEGMPRPGGSGWFVQGGVGWGGGLAPLQDPAAC